MKEREYKESIYDEIIKEKYGESFTYKVNEVKRNQCSICTKRNKNNCRLEFEENRCKNFIIRNI